jgi:hypothetical protein
MTTAAEDVARVDTAETNAMALLGVHAACEALLGLLAATARHRPRDEIRFGSLVTLANTKVGLDDDLIDDLDAMHRIRNDFVHASSTVAADEVARAISNARRLIELAQSGLTSPPTLAANSGTASAVAAVINLDPVGIWLRYADQRHSRRLLEESADALAHALAAALRRTRPRLLPISDGLRWARDLRRIGAGLGPDSDEEATRAEIAGLHRWVVPLALGIQPVAYERLVRFLGSVPNEMPRAAPVAVVRAKDVVITEPELRRATSQTAEIIFRLWAMGSLYPGRDDEQVVEQARSFIERDGHEEVRGDVPSS